MIAELVAKNMKDEAGAIEGYLPLLNALKEKGDEKGVALVEEIISDEKNHQNILQVILLEHDGGIKIAGDHMQETLEYLKKNLG
jgi:rubrerythrin